MKASCLLAAGGLGERFKESKKGLPSKLELPLGSKTLLETTLEPFIASKSILEIIIAVPGKTLSKYRKRFGGIIRQNRPLICPLKVVLLLGCYRGR